MPSLVLHTNPTRRPRSRRAAYTLVELIAASGCMAILMTGMASAVLLATRALDESNDSATSVRQTALATDEFSRDIACALSLQQPSATTLVFIVPDRDGDSQDDTLTYDWSGTPGDPMTRQINDGSTVNILDSVQGMYLSLHMCSNDATATEEPNGDEPVEELLLNYEPTEDLDGFVVTPTYWIGQYLEPNLPGDATSWSVTKVEFEAKMEGFPASTLLVQLRTADAYGHPTSTVVEEEQIAESSLGYVYSPWIEVGYSSVSGLSPGDGICLVLGGSGGTSAGRVQYRYQNATPSDSSMVASTDGGSTWMTLADASLRFRIYGTVTTTSGGSGGAFSTSKVAWIRASIVAGGSVDQQIDAAVQMLNTPEVTTP